MYIPIDVYMRVLYLYILFSIFFVYSFLYIFEIRFYNFEFESEIKCNEQTLVKSARIIAFSHIPGTEGT